MCGICGKISLSGDVGEELIRKMCSVLTHRGPDDEGVMVLDSAKYSSSERSMPRTLVVRGESRS